MTLEKFFEVMFKADMRPKKVSDGVIFRKLLPDHIEMAYARVSDEGDVYLYYFVNTKGTFCPLEDVTFSEHDGGCSLHVNQDSAVVDIDPPEGAFRKEMRRLIKKWHRTALMNS